jgi:hypothetical protein
VALKKLWPSKRQGTTVFSFRLSIEGSLAMAKPCPKCFQYLIDNGVSKVYYSTREGKIEEL